LLLTVEIAEPLATRTFLSQTLPASVFVTLSFLGLYVLREIDRADLFELLHVHHIVHQQFEVAP